MLRANIAPVRLELHAHTPKRFKRVPQEQVLALGIDRRALSFRHQPRSADFQPAILGMNVEIRGQTNHALATATNDDERHVAALLCLLAPALDRRAPFVQRVVRTKRQILPDFGVLRCGK